MSDPFEQIREEFNELRAQNDNLKESIVSQMLALEDVGWSKTFGQITDSGPDLNTLKQIAPELRDMASTNPWHVRGAQLRHAYIFGSGVKFNNIKPKRVEDIIKEPYNKACVFSVPAYGTMNLALFTDGNLFVIRNTKTDALTLVPLEQITGVVTHEDDAQRIHYLQRTWTSNGEQKSIWYPLSRYVKSRPGTLPKTLKGDTSNAPVSRDSVIYHHTTNRQAGWTFGVPDSLAAKVWTIAYSSYLKNNSKLVHAYAQFAWKVTTSTKAGNDNAAARVAVPGIAGTAVMGSGADLSALPRSGSDVDFNNGQALAAAVATSFGVPVIALISSPGASGGSYGTAASLDEPTLKGMTAVQESWKIFLEEILQDIGAKNATVDFPSISSDATYRQAASIALAHASGALFQDEFRKKILDLLDVESLHVGVPEANGFNTYSDPTVIAKATSTVANPVSSQGNTGAVPGGVDQNTTNHDGDATR